MTTAHETRDTHGGRRESRTPFRVRISWGTLTLAGLLLAMVALPVWAIAVPGPPTGESSVSLRSEMQLQEASISVSPAAKEVSIGQSFTIDIVIDPGAESVDSAQAFLEFDPEVLEVQQVTGSGVLPIELTSSYNNTLGQIGYSAVTFGSAASGSFTLASIQIKALAESAGTQISFTFQPPERRTKVRYGLSVLIDHEHGVANDGNVTVSSAGPTATSPPQPTMQATSTEAPTATPTLTPVPGGVDVRINPMSTTVANGNSFTVDVVIEAGSQPVDAAQVYIDFNPTYLNVLGLTGGLTLPKLDESYNNTTGQIGYSAATFGAGATGTFTLVTIQFQAMAVTPATILSYSFIPPRQTKVLYGTTNVLEFLTGGQVEIVASTPTPTPVSAGINDWFVPLVMKNHPTPTYTPVPTIPTITATATEIPTQPTTTATVTETPTITPTPTESPSGCQDLIVNGGMEETLAWIFGNCTAGICPCVPEYTGEVWHNESRSVLIGLTPEMTDTWCVSSMRQKVTIPEGIESATLTYWYKPFTMEEEASSAEGYDWTGFDAQMMAPPAPRLTGAEPSFAQEDWQFVWIYDERLEYPPMDAFDTRSNAGVWTTGSFDLDVSRYAGKTIWVYFAVLNNGVDDKPTWMYVDDAALTVCYQATPTPTFTATPTYTSTPSPTATFTATPTYTPTATPDGDLTMSGIVYDAAIGTTEVISGAHVSVVMCVPHTFHATTGPDGHYNLFLPGSYLNQCSEVTLEAWATGYDTLSQVVPVAGLRTQPQRDFGLTSSLTPTPSPTPTTECQEVVENRGFEKGNPQDNSDALEWTEVATEMMAGRSNDEAHAGDWSMRAGIPRGGTPRYSYSSAWQELELPPGDVITATLRFWYYSESDRPIYDGDAQYFVILNRWGAEHEIGRLDWSESNQQTWVEWGPYDVSGYAWPIRVHFEVYNNVYHGTTRMYIDDVSVEVCVEEGSQTWYRYTSPERGLIR